MSEQRPSGPIFIVGLPRSGTTLMAVCLDRHPAIHCGPETHLFRRLSRPRNQMALDPGHWPDAAVQLIGRIVTKSGPASDLRDTDLEAVRVDLAGRSPSAAAIMEALVVPPTIVGGKRRWAEKTPQHLDYLRQIRAAWPDAAVVHMVRDPRSRAVSISHVPFGSESLVQNLLEGMRRERRSRAQVVADPRLLTIRLEDLQADPEATLRSVCEFLGEPFDAAMLVPSDEAAAAPTTEWWKAAATGPVTASGRSSWQASMPEDVQRFASLYCAEQLQRYGYPGARAARSTIVVVPSAAWFMEEHEAQAVALAAQDVRIDELSQVTWQAVRRIRSLVYAGAPDQLLPHGRGRRDTRRVAVALSVDLLARWLLRRPAAWIPAEPVRTGAPGSAATADKQLSRDTLPQRLLGVAVRCFARRIEPTDLDGPRDSGPGGQASR